MDKFVVNKTMAAVDSLAKLRAKISTLRAEEDELEIFVKTQLSKKAEGVPLKGYVFSVMTSSYDMRRLSEVKLGKYLSPTLIAKCYNKTRVSKIVFSKLDK